MDYRETKTSKLIKSLNKRIYEYSRILILKNGSEKELKAAELELKRLNMEADYLTQARAEEIASERCEYVELRGNLITLKGDFIDCQRQFDLTDEETRDYIIMCGERTKWK